MVVASDAVAGFCPALAAPAEYLRGGLSMKIVMAREEKVS
jgi:hypothetical protein